MFFNELVETKKTPCWNEFGYFAIALRSRRNNRRFKPVAWQSQPPRPWARSSVMNVGLLCDGRPRGNAPSVPLLVFQTRSLLRPRPVAAPGVNYHVVHCTLARGVVTEPITENAVDGEERPVP